MAWVSARGCALVGCEGGEGANVGFMCGGSAKMALWRLVAVLVGLVVAAGIAPAHAQDAPAAAGAERKPFVFGLWGDMPYAVAGDHAKMPALIASMNAAPIEFSIFDGDIKDGGSKCTDDVYSAAIALFNQLKKPVVYVPGDNEWTDCHRTSNGGYDNLERLSHLRKTMFAKTESFGAKTMALEHQGKPGEKFAENTRFFRSGVMFVMLNIPGSNNNKVLNGEFCASHSVRTPAQCEADNAEYASRDAANTAWMRAAFAKARAEKAVGIMVVMQANPGFDEPLTKLNEGRLASHDGYWAFMDALAEETRGFGGQVVLVHGDTHWFRVDKPWPMANFTRVETFGSPFIHWVRATVDPASPQVFTFEPVRIPGHE